MTTGTRVFDTVRREWGNVTGTSRLFVNVTLDSGDRIQFTAEAAQRDLLATAMEGDKP